MFVPRNLQARAAEAAKGGADGYRQMGRAVALQIGSLMTKNYDLEEAALKLVEVECARTHEAIEFLVREFPAIMDLVPPSRRRTFAIAFLAVAREEGLSL